MKKQLISLFMMVVMVFAASSLLAPTGGRVDVETKLTANSKQWGSYMTEPKAPADKDQTLAFNRTSHKVAITSGGTASSKKWSITLSPSDGPATLVIGTDSYLLTFGADSTHPEFMILKNKKGVSTYYRSTITR